MPGKRGLGKVGYEEHGQRAARSTDSYAMKMGVTEVAECSGCKALYWKKRWYLGEDESIGLSRDMVRNHVVCPACAREADKNPGGVVTLQGEYLGMHQDEIMNIVKNSEHRARLKNPLARIMEVKQEPQQVTILTLEEKLAQRLGRDVFKAHSGNLDYQWTKEENFVRVNWKR